MKGLVEASIYPRCCICHQGLHLVYFQEKILELDPCHDGYHILNLMPTAYVDYKNSNSYVKDFHLKLKNWHD